MSATILYRSASALILLFAVGHTLGFRKSDPSWKADALLSSMRSLQFRTQGFERTYWDFYVGFGLFVSVFLVLAAILAWQLGDPTVMKSAPFRTLAWALAACFVIVTFLSWKYFFIAPIVFSAIISGLLVAAASLS